MRKYAWKRDLPDIRDFKFRDHHLLGAIQLPPSVDLRPQMPPVVDQGNSSSCTANALSGVLGFLELQALKNNVVSSEEFNSSSFLGFSRLFIYFNERTLEGDPTADNGAQIRDGIKTLTQYGGCDEKIWPYDLNNLFIKPNNPCYSEALQHKISSYYSLDNDLFALKSALAIGCPIIFGFTLYDYFESPEMAQFGILNLPKPTEECLGGHAVVLCGYNDADRTFWVRNSWGSAWGPFGGYFKISYDYISNPDLADDFWVIKQ